MSVVSLPKQFWRGYFGVLSLDKNGQVTLANASAISIFGKAGSYFEVNISDLLPDLVDSIEQAYARPDKVPEGSLCQTLEKGRRTLMAEVGIELLGDRILVRLSRLTILRMYKRRSARWLGRMFARRIAHEIKTGDADPVVAERLTQISVSVGEDDQPGV